MKLSTKRIIALACVVMMLAITAIPCFAAEPTSVPDAMKDGINTIKADVTSILLVVIPAGLAIFGIVFGVRKGIAALRSTGGGS